MHEGQDAVAASERPDKRGAPGIAARAAVELDRESSPMFAEISDSICSVW